MNVRRVSVIAGVAVAVMATGAVQAPASQSAPTDVAGSVLVEAPTPEAVACAWRQGGDEAQGVLGWVIELQPDEGDGTHLYQFTTQDGLSSLDLAFFHELPTCEPDDEPHPFLEYQISDHVPAGSRWVVIGRWTAQFTYGGTIVHPRIAAATHFRFQVEVPEP